MSNILINNPRIKSPIVFIKDGEFINVKNRMTGQNIFNYDPECLDVKYIFHEYSTGGYTAALRIEVKERKDIGVNVSQYIGMFWLGRWSKKDLILN
jgi:hypothetical protein